MPARLLTGWRVAQRAFSYQRSGALQVGNCMHTDKPRMHTGRHDVAAKSQTIILAHSLLPLLLFPLFSGLSSLPSPLAHLLACSHFLSLAPLTCDTISSRGHQWKGRLGTVRQTLAFIGRYYDCGIHHDLHSMSSMPAYIHETYTRTYLHGYTYMHQ